MPPSQSLFSTKPSLQFVKEDLQALLGGPRPPLQCVQEAGDVLLLPGGACPPPR